MPFDLTKCAICHNGHTITVGAPGAAAHLAHHNGDTEGDGDTEGACEPEGTTPEPPGGTTPTLTTQATASATLGDPISDTAALSGATSDATGDITLKVYGPFDPTTDPTTDQCIDSGTDANLVTTLGPFPIGSPDANGDYVVSSDDPADTTDDFAPTQADRYQWVASYSGDTNNEAVSSECNADSEQSTVSDTSSTTATEQNMPLAAKTGDATKLTQGNKDPDITNGTDQSDTIRRWRWPRPHKRSALQRQA